MQNKKTIENVFLLFLFLGLVLLLLFKLPISKPVTQVVEDFLFSFSSKMHFSLGQNSSEQKLKEENLNLSEKLVDQAKILADNRALRDQFQTQSIQTQALIEAKVVGSPSFIPGITLPEYLVLDKGLAQGIEKGQAVVYKDNLVGFITNASQNFSKVELLSNSNFSETVRTISTNSLGVAKGQGGGGIILDNVLLSQTLQKGELVVTKGDKNENGIGVLPDLVIGKISSVNKNPSSLFQLAKIEPLLDFSKLSIVFIYK